MLGDSVKPIFDAGLVQLVELDHVISPEIRLTPSTSHMPGHVSVMIESEGERAVITGDMAHHPCQLAHPDWSLGDNDPRHTPAAVDAIHLGSTSFRVPLHGINKAIGESVVDGQSRNASTIMEIICQA
ncbi:MAG: hypothetical protein QOE55_450 [Acidobacteriaceae bacterium]|jgi:glyoxylase-like metal-dependent hydrolase (beta-lactamase superfamily II)|nr:hypothetical protein [Acidobacteriaceae bacterium]